MDVATAFGRVRYAGPLYINFNPYPYSYKQYFLFTLQSFRVKSKLKAQAPEELATPLFFSAQSYPTRTPLILSLFLTHYTDHECNKIKSFINIVWAGLKSSELKTYEALLLLIIISRKLKS